MGAINIIGAGLAGLSAAVTLAERGVPCRLISLQPSERAQSVLAEGGINAALDTMGEQDSPALHFEDTVKGGCDLADPNAVAALTEHAPETVRWLESLGVPFARSGGEIALRSFGGQRKKRTAYAQSSTGKMLMTALIDEARKYEAQGLIRRYSDHELIRLVISGGECRGAHVRDRITGLCAELPGRVILASGGMNGMFPSRTTGTVMNSGDVTATAFSQGVLLSSPEMIQFHPTTVGIPGKRCLVSEAARGEGGRLFIAKATGEKWYFMEEKYPELGNLSPRDVVSREMYFARRQEDTAGEVCLDMTGLSEDIWKNRLSDLREELIRYTGIDPKNTPVPVHEGIHYFMGGIDVDIRHRTNIPGLYAAGECCGQYHGANRLGGNSMLGAVYGGRTAAETAAEGFSPSQESEPAFAPLDDEPLLTPARESFNERLAVILTEALGIVRRADVLESAIGKVRALSEEAVCQREKLRCALALAMLRGALERRESRGAHYREDFPQRSDDFRRTTVARFEANDAVISFREIPERRAEQ